MYIIETNIYIVDYNSFLGKIGNFLLYCILLIKIYSEHDRLSIFLYNLK